MFLNEILALQGLITIFITTTWTSIYLWKASVDLLMGSQISNFRGSRSILYSKRHTFLMYLQMWSTTWVISWGYCDSRCNREWMANEIIQIHMIQTQCMEEKCTFCWMILSHWPLGNLDMILKKFIFGVILLIDIFTISSDNALRWMPRDLADDKSTLVQIMAWCC